jgi:hypothetical protein
VENNNQKKKKQKSKEEVGNVHDVGKKRLIHAAPALAETACNWLHVATVSHSPIISKQRVCLVLRVQLGMIEPDAEDTQDALRADDDALCHNSGGDHITIGVLREAKEEGIKCQKFAQSTFGKQKKKRLTGSEQNAP